MTERSNSFFKDLNGDPVTKFSKVYFYNLFGGQESRSGEGSGLFQTRHIRKDIPKLLNKLEAASLIDAPCGDLFWIKAIELPVERYIGIDIVPELIQDNKRRYRNRQRSFLEMNIIEDRVPQADVILCRDCLVHLSFDECRKVIENFKKSGSKYLLTTTFTDRPENNDLVEGLWRPLNLEISPFNFPKPITVINEKCMECDGEFSDKSLGLWLLDSIVLG